MGFGKNNPDRVPNPVRVNHARYLRYNMSAATGRCEYLQKIGNTPVKDFSLLLCLNLNVLRKEEAI
ncbi:MAG: hypothetical protein CV087_03315 [Candidatus Brocadia sp. WS118]|nr:MAG: hypothetical protein CV087_03315 [Candidatus Brocadia sp. WS118]